MSKRRIEKKLKEKYDMGHKDAPFIWFPNQKLKPCGDFGIVPKLPWRNEDIKEVKSIIGSFRPKHIPSQGNVKDLFRQSGWETNYRFFPEEGLWNFDAYKNGVAVEVLGRHVDEVFKDCFKFLLAYKVKQIEIGVIIVPHQCASAHGRADAVNVDAILHRFSPVLMDYGLWILRASYSVVS